MDHTILIFHPARYRIVLRLPRVEHVGRSDDKQPVTKAQPAERYKRLLRERGALLFISFRRSKTLGKDFQFSEMILFKCYKTRGT
jgi:hypothetical protein